VSSPPVYKRKYRIIIIYGAEVELFTSTYSRYKIGNTKLSETYRKDMMRIRQDSFICLTTIKVIRTNKNIEISDSNNQ